MIQFKDFLRRAIKKHGDKFVYDENTYTNYEIPFSIKCTIHGKFNQVPKTHIRGYGCPKCGHKKGGQKITSNTNDFIIKSKTLHGDKYDYSKVVYNKNSEKVIIICSLHGEFLQKPNYHLLGNGCPKCGGTKKLTTEDFIQKSQLIHNNVYDYSQVSYVSNKQKVKIICKKHGEFMQSPSHHMRGAGCQRCNESKGEKLISFILKKNNITFVREYKFDDCRYRKALPFDFYLPDLHMCIEYDGEQHFEVWRMNDTSAANDRLEQIKLRDSIKTEYCANNSIKLIRIKYTDNIEEQLNNIINV